MQQAIAVLDVGKTRSKLSCWSLDGRLLRQLDRANGAGDARGQLDFGAIADWLIASLAHLVRLAEITAIIPVGHGAAAMLLDGEGPVCALDYEAPIPPQVEAAYDPERDPFAVTLSPRLPGGLNLGAQLFWIEQIHPQIWPDRGKALLWPQYWAFALCGESASEVTSLGCHSDLWRPHEHRHSDLARRRGWADRLGPIRGAGEILGPVRREVAASTGLASGCQVHCGLHDSNAALHAARGFAELAGGPFSLVSTGTWFVCMAAGGDGPAVYDPREDMLANVDVEGRPIPTARFMGGREYEALMGEVIGAAPRTELMEQASALEIGAGAGPGLLATRASLELARRTDRALGLIAAEGPILIEGRFASDPVFGACLAALRPSQPVYRSELADGVARGALRLVLGDRLAASPLIQVAG